MITANHVQVLLEVLRRAPISVAEQMVIQQTLDDLNAQAAANAAPPEQPRAVRRRRKHQEDTPAC
jgi:hypothetical protein